MSTWECRECTAAYAPGAPACPQCGTSDPIKETEQLQRELETMPKITVHGGPSNADTGEGMPEPVEGQVVESAGGPYKPLPELTGDPEQDSAEQTVEPDYEAWTVEQLKDQLDSRGLPKTGKKDELVLRLLEDDDARAAEAENAEAEKSAE